MSKGAPDDTEQTIITELPEYAQPYFLRMMDRAESQSRVPYLRYPGERQAAFTDSTNQGLDMVRGIAGLEAQPRSDEPYVDVPYQDIPEEFLAPPSPDPEQWNTIDRLRGKIGGLEDELEQDRQREKRAGEGRRAEGGLIERRYATGGLASVNSGGAVSGTYFGDALPLGVNPPQLTDNIGTVTGTGQLTGSDTPTTPTTAQPEAPRYVTPNLPPEVAQAAQTARGVSGYEAGPIGSNYQAGEFQTGQFDSQAVDQYMNPYIENVLDRLQDRTQERYERSRSDIGLQAAQAGAYGGSRERLASAQMQEDLFQQLADTEAGQLSEGYRQAGQLFNADQTRALQAQQSAEQARFGAGQLDLQGQQASEQARYGAQQLNLNAAGQLAGIGQLKQNMGLQQSQALIQAGQLEQQQNQQTSDLALQEFLRERGYEAEQISFLSNILRGVPVGQNQTSTTSTAGPNPFSQAVGLGIAGAGLANQYGLFDSSPAV